MLERIHIENYKCLREVTVDLADFTILIGPNDSGKSSLLEAIQTLGKLAREPQPSFLAGDKALGNLVWMKDSGRCIVWQASGKALNEPFLYRIELPVHEQPARESLEYRGKRILWTERAQNNQEQPGASPPVRCAWISDQGMGGGPALVGRTMLSQLVQGNQEPFARIASALASSMEYEFDIAKLRLAAIPETDCPLHESGDNLAGVLDVLQNSNPPAFAALQRALHEAIPTLQGVVVPPVREPRGAKAVHFLLSANGQQPVTVPGSLASGGALLVTAFLTLTHTETAGLLLIEEPENGLHPFRLQLVIDLLRKISKGEVGSRKRQVVLTTHNPLLLNYARPEEVRVFVRHPDKGTHVIPMTKVPDIDRLLKEFALGELWYLLGEEKLFEGQPA